MTERGRKQRVAQVAESRKRVLAQRLHALMDKEGLSVNELARRVQNELSGEKFNPVNLSHYRAGRSLPRPRYLTALSKAFGVSADDLVPPEHALKPAEPALDPLPS